MSIKIPKSERRTPEQLRRHYEIEKKLANKLRNSSKSERRYLYTALYDELFKLVPDHPQLTLKTDRESRLASVHRKMNLLKRFLKEDSVFLEIGSGDCLLSFEVAKRVKKVFAVDVSTRITRNESFPENFELIISDGSSIPVRENSITVAYSDQLMEHLHPDDALEQLQNIYKSLAPGGIYICITPNRLSGPHDISKYFDRIATGFHLKEYTIAELKKKFRKTGFSKIGTYIGGRGFYIKFPLFLTILCERILSLLPFSLRRKVANIILFKAILGIIIIGEKKNNK